ncbi:TPM domain-containing protein [Fusibacter paucivorans]|uniref:TPM domain-containing protein n=1 Tax=Fusibacter paucivorans TaxID=76009 RepID=A0ABS5PJX6_9FIRM|nr:TPM domain-containing protein [Fusibacter paucivorans]
MLKQKLIVLLAILILAMPFAFAVDYPSPTSDFYVEDYADLLASDTEQTIIETSAALEAASGAQIVVVTVPSLEGDTVENYAYNLFQNWGIGDADKNNGVLLLIAMDDRMTRIEVGYGLEGILNDGKTGRIQDDYLIENLKAGDYDAGVLGTYLAIAEEVYQEYDLSADDLAAQNVYYNPVAETSDSGGITIGKIIIGIIVFILMLFDIIFNRGRIIRMLAYASMRGGGRGGGGGFGGGGGRSGGGGSSRSF